MTEVVVTSGAIRRAKLQSNRHHQQTNTHVFTGRMPFLSPNQQCQSTEGKRLEQMENDIKGATCESRFVENDYHARVYLSLIT